MDSLIVNYSTKYTRRKTKNCRTKSHSPVPARRGSLTPKRLWLAFLPGIIILALVAAGPACGDGDDDNGPESASLVVNTADDVSERDSDLSLREAIELATGVLLSPDLTDEELAQVDGDPGNESADTITFDLQEGAVIELGEALPSLTRGNDVIDGEGAVTIDGSVARFDCLSLASDGNAVYGLRITGCHTALHLTNAAFQNIVGGAGQNEGNVIIDGVVGIEINGRENIVRGNHIGVETASTEAHGNEFEGIWLTPAARDNIVGGAGQGEGNVISANPLFGISIDGARGTVVQGNYLGLDTAGRVAVGNHTALKLVGGAFDNLIGGNADGEANVISGNRIGLRVTDEDTTGNRIIGNIFGKSAGQGERIPNDEDIYEDEGAGANDYSDNIIE
jgi:hypothetical protein